MAENKETIETEEVVGGLVDSTARYDETGLLITEIPGVGTVRHHKDGTTEIISTETPMLDKSKAEADEQIGKRVLGLRREAKGEIAKKVTSA